MIQAAQGKFAIVRIEPASQGSPPAPAPQMPQAPDQDIVDHPEAPDQVELLVDHAHVDSMGAKGSPREAVEALIAEADGSAGGGGEAGQAAEEGGLACPGSPDDRDELSRQNREREGIQRAPISEGFADAVENDRWRDWEAHGVRERIHRLLPLVDGWMNLSRRAVVSQSD